MSPRHEVTTSLISYQISIYQNINNIGGVLSASEPLQASLNFPVEASDPASYYRIRMCIMALTHDKRLQAGIMNPGVHY